MVVLHVGAPRTGTTAVQDSPAVNDGRLPGLVDPPVLRDELEAAADQHRRITATVTAPLHTGRAAVRR